MQKINVTDHNGKKHVLPALEGWTIMEIIRDAGLSIKAECGGACSCATCHVYVSDEWVDKLHKMREDEEEMLDEAFDVDEDTSRLSCQIIFTAELDGMDVALATY